MLHASATSPQTLPNIAALPAGNATEQARQTIGEHGDDIGLLPPDSPSPSSLGVVSLVSLDSLVAQELESDWDGEYRERPLTTREFMEQEGIDTHHRERSPRLCQGISETRDRERSLRPRYRLPDFNDAY